MKILDIHQGEVIILESSVSCYPFSTPVVEVKLPNGQIIGHVERDVTFIIPKFTITNARCETVLRIEGPMATTSFGGNVDFDVSVFGLESRLLIHKINGKLVLIFFLSLCRF